MNVIADHLADHAVEEYEPLKFDFSDKDVLSVKEGNQIGGLCTLMVIW